MIPDTIVMGIPKALMTIALIPPILKYVFGLEKHSNKQTQKPDITQYAKSFINKQAFSDFGGRK